MKWLPKREVSYDTPTVLRSLALGLALYAAAAAGMTYVAGFGAITDRLSHARWWWLVLAFAAVIAAFVGYGLGYRGIHQPDDKHRLTSKIRLAVATAGFGGFLAQGGGALDEYAMQADGASGREARVRALALGGFEQGTLALLVCPTAVVAVILGLGIPRPDFTWPWALIPLPGFVFAAWLAARYRRRLRAGQGWREAVARLLDALHVVVFELFLRPRKRAAAIGGMLLFWAGEMLALWASTAAFGYRMGVPAVIVGLGSGMIITRRTAPLGGAGIITLALVPTLWYGSGVPLAAATLGVLFYGLFTLWLPVIPGLGALPALRAVGAQASVPGEQVRVRRRAPALQH